MESQASPNPQAAHQLNTLALCRGYIEGGLPLNIMEGQGIGLSEMINAMAAQQHIYTAAAYGGIEAAAYAPYPQYVTQGPYVTTAARPVRDSYESFNGYEPERRKERRDREERRRDRDRDRDRDRRDRDRDRDRDRRDRDRDRDREHRWRDDNRDRSPHRDRRDRDRDYDRDRDRDRDRDGGGSDYKTQPPNNTIMVRGLAQHITENDIRADILACNLMPKDIRLVRKKESGASRGFAFVEFTTVHDATRWMEAKQGVLILQDMYRATLQYSIPKESSERHAKASQDWFCIKCGAHNFKRRDSCFKCSAPRHESEAGNEGSDEVCTYPTNTLLMRGLDILSTEESVLQGIQHAGSDLPIRSVRIGRDSLTNTSRGVCYIELNSVMDSMQLHNKLVQSPPVIDGKQVTISYCKLSQNTGSGSGTYGNWSQHQPAEYTAGADIKQLAEYSASLYAQSPEEHTAYVQYYTQYYQQQAQAYQQGQQQQQQQSGTQSDSVNAAAAVAQSALQAMQQKSSAPTVTTVAATAAVASATPTTYTAAVTTTTTTTEQTLTTPTGYELQNASDYQTYPTPNVSAYQYDESSGYYYDPSTGLYYDASSQYYYNSETGQYMYWDAEKSTYMPAPVAEDEGKEKGDKKDKEKDKQEKVKVAKKIAKDMQRWAKAQNKRNESAAVKVAPAEPAGGSTRGGGAADAAFAVLVERKDRASLEKQAQVFQMHLKKDPSVLSMSSLKKPSGLVAAYGGEGSDSEEEPSAVGGEDRAEEKMIDLTKMACLLCKRQFPNREALNRHVQLSDLHKKNLEGMRKSKESCPNLAGLQYRDRAKERRQKYGEPEVPPPNRLKEKYMAAREEASSTTYEEPTKKGIGSDNIGNKLLKKMGWSDGQGLGKANQGRTSIIETERRVATAGLGMQGSTYSVVGDSYKECVKKMMFHRYQELDALEKEAAKNGSV